MKEEIEHLEQRIFDLEETITLIMERLSIMEEKGLNLNWPEIIRQARKMQVNHIPRIFDKDPERGEIWVDLKEEKRWLVLRIVVEHNLRGLRTTFVHLVAENDLNNRRKPCLDAFKLSYGREGKI